MVSPPLNVQLIIMLLMAFNLLFPNKLNSALDFNKFNFSFKSISFIFFNISLKVTPFKTNNSDLSIATAVAVLFPF